ncbi:hypothetical protein OJF2_53150 [Aquisphaera giovannonii]|uniref:Uncharacterized protein n=1 Tax=Aquisphaera giovannonii TaxID=406548 RepID=A0A5B9WA49_9BACT|nr:hypothetical protein [Aquisphaera giovannonii]QEH36730.1 hypothetical protein OJF2_53150 [Aquisphaera giovannonii]
MRRFLLVLGLLFAFGCADQSADLTTQAAQQTEQMRDLNSSLIGSSRHPAWFQ